MSESVRLLRQWFVTMAQDLVSRVKRFVDMLRKAAQHSRKVRWFVARLRSALLSPNEMLRFAAMLLAVVIAVRSLVAGTIGILSIVLVLGAAVLLWRVIRIAPRIGKWLTDAKGQPSEAGSEARQTPREQVSDKQTPGQQVSDMQTPGQQQAGQQQAGQQGRQSTGDPAAGQRTPGKDAQDEQARARARLVGVLAALVLVVQTAMIGHLDVWTILIAVLLAVITTLLSPNLRLAAVLGSTAAVFGVATVFAADMLQGNAEARALAVSIAGIVLPVLVSDRIIASAERLKLPKLTTRHRAILAVLTLLFGFFGWTRSEWLPGVMSGCYTLPTSTGITMLRATPDSERCYGLLDIADPGVFAAHAFGRDPDTIDLQRAILAENEPLKDGDLTVVWLGSLSCDPLPSDPTRCADGRDYPSERDQLRALLFAQKHFKQHSGEKRLHVVIADATQDVAHADDIAKMIIDRRKALGPRLVVIGGGDSRDVTQRAINRLLDAGVPFISPNLLADLAEPGAPFVNRPGYLQLAPSNKAYAEDVVNRLKFDGGYRLDIYQEPEPTDHYTTSLVNDLLAVVRDLKRPDVTARHVAALDRIDDGICDSNTDGPPTALYFADRWTRFANFVQRVNEVCGHARPHLVIADVSVSRFLGNNHLRAVSNADWAIDYHVSGPSCADLTPAGLAAITAQIHKSRELVRLPEGARFTCVDRIAAASRELLDACPLDAAVKQTAAPCRPNDLGTYLIPTWDAVFLADALLPKRPVPLDKLTLEPLTLSTGMAAEVKQGRLTAPTIAARMWHADPLNDPRRIYEEPSERLGG